MTPWIDVRPASPHTRLAHASLVVALIPVLAFAIAMVFEGLPVRANAGWFPALISPACSVVALVMGFSACSERREHPAAIIAILISLAVLAISIFLGGYIAYAVYCCAG